jgi:hypothetical protein
VGRWDRDSTNPTGFQPKLIQPGLLFGVAAQWARFSKNLQKLIIPDPVHILSIPIPGKGKIA